MAVKQDVLYFVLFPNHGMYLRNFFVLKRVSVSNPQQLTYTQVLVEYRPPPPGFVRFKLSYYMEVNRTLKSIAQNM